MGSILKEAGAGDAAKASTTGLTVGGIQHLAHEYHDSEEAKERDYQNQVGKVALGNFEKDQAIVADPNKPQAEKVAAQQRIDTSEQFLASLSVKELEELKQIKEGNAAIVAALSPEKFAALMKSDKLTDSQKGSVRDARFKDFSSDMDVINNPGASAVEKAAAKRRIQQRGVKELQHAPPNILNRDDVLNTLSPSQQESLLKEDGVTTTIKNKLRALDPLERIKSAFATANNTASPALGIDVSRLSPKQVAKLSGDILGSSNVAGRLTTQMLNEINTTNEISDAARNNIKRVLAARAASDPRIAAYLASPAGQFNWT